MWICFSDAFLSIVEPPKKDGTLLVRARRQGDIERVFAGAKVEKTPGRDYLFRALIPREQVAYVIGQHVAGIGYQNFKSSVSDNRLHDAFAGVWSIMARLQPIPPYSRGRTKQGDLL